MNKTLTHLAAFAIATLPLTACATDAPANDHTIAPGDVMRVTWSTPTYVDGSAHGNLACTAEVSHPCPYVTYARTLVVSNDGTTITWTDAAGGADANGMPVRQHVPFVDELALDGAGNIVLAQRGDDGGLRRAARLAAVSEGFEGAINYYLFNQAGTTTFGLTLAFVTEGM